MPTIWRFLLGEYCKVLTLCTLAFLALLVATRLEEIVQFAALGATHGYLFRFVLYQLPYIVPIALPISALISSFLLMRRLSANHELTALRSSGLGLRQILAPILLTAAMLSLGNFVIASELSTHAHLMKRLLRKELKSLNPLILLQSDRLAHLKGVYAQSFGAGKAGEYASDVLICVYNPKQLSLNILTAKEIRAEEDSLQAKQVTLISSLPSQEEAFDDLIVENSASLSLPKPDLTYLLGNSGVKIEHDHLKLSLLLARANDLSIRLSRLSESLEDSKSSRQLKNQLASTYSEIIKRISLAIAVFTFTLLGLAYGIQVSRVNSYRSIAMVILLATLTIACFFAAKNVAHHLTASMWLYLAPHGILLAFSLRTIQRVSRGQHRC